MAKQFLTPIDLNLLELQNVRLQQLASDPSPTEAQIYYNTGSKKIRFYNGTSWVALEDSGSVTGVSSVLGTAPIVANTVGNDVTVSITAATTVAAGSMSATDKTKLDAATNLNTVSTLVLRDASGNFSAGTITASLTGTASNASLLQNENGAHYLARANHTGTQAASTISDLATVVQAYRLDQFAAPTSSVAFNNQKITGLGTPTEAADAVTKSYVDGLSSGLDYKDSVRAATTANITLSGTQTIDGVAVVAGNRVLVKNQGTASANGIYEVAAGAWARTADAIQGTLSSGAFVYVEEGTANGGSKFVLSTVDPITVGTTEQTWVVYGAGEVILAGDGLTKTGSTIDVVGTADRITVAADSIDIASTYVGQTSITTLGTITTGTWQGTTIAANQGGTGIASYTAGNYVNALTATTLQQRTPTEVRGDIGAAATVHVHSGADITSGIVGVGFGGTGQTTYTNGQLLIGNTTGNTLTKATLTGTANRLLVTNGTGTITLNVDATDANTVSKVVARDASGNFAAGTITAALAGNATTATTLATGRTIAISGPITGTATSFNGSTNITIPVTALDVSHTSVTGALAVDHGGTGLATVATNSFLKGNGTGNLVPRTYTEVKTDLALNNVENTALSTWVGSSAITTLGTIGTGTWAATDVAVLHGGTGASTIAGAKTNLGFITTFAQTIGDAVATSFVVSHNFGTQDVVVRVYEDGAGGEEVEAGVVNTSVNAVTVSFATAPATNAYRVVVQG